MNYESELRKNGVVILDVTSDEELVQIIFNNQNVSIEKVVIDGRQKVILRLSSIKSQEELDKLFNEAHKAYDSKNYGLSLAKYREILLAKPIASVYCQMGNCCMKLRKFEQALLYYTIAESLNPTNKKITKLKNGLLNSKAVDFANRVNYNVNNLEEIITLYNNHVSLDEACERYNLTDEEKDIVYLVVAKEYYHEGLEKLGDKYLKLVEKNSNKSKYVNYLINEIKKNKKFYLYREKPISLLKKNLH